MFIEQLVEYKAPVLPWTFLPFLHHHNISISTSISCNNLNTKTHFN